MGMDIEDRPSGYNSRVNGDMSFGGNSARGVSFNGQPEFRGASMAGM
jgi:hypothetical protein